MSKLLSSFLFLVFVAFLVESSEIKGQDPKVIKMSGDILDINGALIPDAFVNLKNVGDQKVIITRSDKFGNFVFEGGSGEYLITVNKPGFCPYSRSGIFLRPGDAISLTVPLIVCSIVTNTTVGDGRIDPRSEDSYLFPYFLCDIPVQNMDSKISQVRILFRKKTEIRNTVIFAESNQSDKSVFPVILTYDKVQVRAKSVSLFKDGSFLAEGQVLFEDGVTSLEYSRLQFRISNGKFIRLSHL